MPEEYGGVRTNLRVALFAPRGGAEPGIKAKAKPYFDGRPNDRYESILKLELYNLGG